jgi:hypothetical protein
VSNGTSNIDVTPVFPINFECRSSSSSNTFEVGLEIHTSGKSSSVIGPHTVSAELLLTKLGVMGACKSSSTSKNHAALSRQLRPCCAKSAAPLSQRPPQRLPQLPQHRLLQQRLQLRLVSCAFMPRSDKPMPKPPDHELQRVLHSSLGEKAPGRAASKSCAGKVGLGFREAFLL